MSMDLCYRGHNNVYNTVFNAGNTNMLRFVNSVTDELGAAYKACCIEVNNCKSAMEWHEDSEDRDYYQWLVDNHTLTKSMEDKLEECLLAWGTVCSSEESKLTVEQYLYILGTIMYQLPRETQYYVRCSVRDLPGVLNHIGNVTVSVL